MNYDQTMPLIMHLMLLVIVFCFCLRHRLSLWGIAGAA